MPQESRWNLGFLRRNCMFGWFLLAESLNSPCSLGHARWQKRVYSKATKISILASRKHHGKKCSISSYVDWGIEEILWDGKPVPALKGVSCRGSKCPFQQRWNLMHPTWNGDKVSYHWDAQLNYDPLLGRDFLHAGLVYRSIFTQNSSSESVIGGG